MTSEDVGQLAIVRGTVIEVNFFSAGVKLTLDDGTGTVIALLWQDVYDGLRNGPEPGIGAEMQVQGEISQYRGEMEIVPELAEDVQVLAAAAPAEETLIGTLTTADVGRHLARRNVGPDLADSVNNLIRQCDSGRFGASGTEHDRAAMMLRAREMLTRLEREL